MNIYYPAKYEEGVGDPPHTFSFIHSFLLICFFLFVCFFFFCFFFKSPEPKAHKLSLYYGSRAGVRRLSSTFSNNFSSEAARPNLFIFYI